MREVDSRPPLTIAYRTNMFNFSAQPYPSAPRTSPDPVFSHVQTHPRTRQKYGGAGAHHSSAPGEDTGYLLQKITMFTKSRAPGGSDIGDMRERTNWNCSKCSKNVAGLCLQPRTNTPTRTRQKYGGAGAASSI
eukprot:954934-Prymnesium_polylepis.1